MDLAWCNDGHKVLAVLDGDTVHAEVRCPALRLGTPLPRLKCGMGNDEASIKNNPPDFCVVKEVIEEWGWELNITGLKIMVRGLIPIEYAWEDEETMLWKVCGYPSYEEAKTFREEAIESLSPNTKLTHLPVDLFPLKSWDEVDEETRDGLRESIELHIQNDERKRRARKNR